MTPMQCLDALNGQICEGGVCTRVPATGDMIAVSLAWKAGQQAMAVTMRTSSTQKLNAIALTVGALGSTFVQGFFLTYISEALSSITGLDIDLTDDPIGNFTNCTQVAARIMKWSAATLALVQSQLLQLTHSTCAPTFRSSS